MKKIDIRDIKESAAAMIGDGWALVTAGDREKFNPMTVSWGALGEIWGKDAAFIFIRPSRFTYGLLEKGGCFTLTFYDKKYRPALSLCGSKSGRDINKAEAAGLTPVFLDGAVTFEEAKYTVICKTIASQNMDPKGFIDPEIEENYDGGDYHKMYVGEIVGVYEN